jgi:hypothetical protein
VKHCPIDVSTILYITLDMSLLLLIPCDLKNNTQFLLELISFFAWLTLTSGILDLTLCALMIKDFPYLIRKYYFTLLMKTTLLIYM